MEILNRIKENKIIVNIVINKKEDWIGHIKLSLRHSGRGKQTRQ